MIAVHSDLDVYFVVCGVTCDLTLLGSDVRCDVDYNTDL